MLMVHDANATNSVIFHISQIPEQFTILAIHMRLVPSDANDVEDAGSLSPNSVHLLQGAVGCLWEEE